ncbi:MAG: ATP synthase F1 subunit epsilon [Caulobacterales bacterium 32-69-10]|jgi:F-type H+-transporting ATPase subunit epsilon|nr:MAG: ATP synthase F1 subunit epsilon [Caulobacterales bacterium 32-69-10]
MSKFLFSLVAPERELYSGEVDQVDAPGAEGDFGVLAGHEPFMTTLRPGQVLVRDGSKSRIFTIEGGFADVTPESFTILAESAVEAAAH